MRVVITGLGVVSPVGIGKDVFWKSLLAGKSGINFIKRFDAKSYPVKIAGEVKDFDSKDFLSIRDAKRSDRVTHYAVAASKMAWEDAKLDKMNMSRVGVILGSGIGGITTYQDQLKIMWTLGNSKVSPLTIPMFIPNMPAGFTAISLGIKGPCLSISTACSSATNSIGEAFHLLKRGEADVVIAGGSEAALTEGTLAAFSAMRVLSLQNDCPQKASRPFDKNRDGFVIGEGAGVLVLETLENAVERKAAIYAELVGYGFNSDAYHITTPSPNGDQTADCMVRALHNAGLFPQDIDYINAHGTSTVFNDLNETLAIKKVFGSYAKDIPISAVKSMTGHLLGASGGIESIATVLALKNEIIPPTINYEQQDPQLDLDFVPNVPRKKKMRYAVKNSFGFGGFNSTLLFKKWGD